MLALDVHMEAMTHATSLIKGRARQKHKGPTGMIDFLGLYWRQIGIETFRQIFGLQMSEHQDEEYLCCAKDFRVCYRVKTG